MPRRLTLAAARRAALAAQGLGGSRPGRVTARHLQAEIDRVAQFQIDSISVAVRAHLMPLYARRGAYDPALLTRASSTSPRRLFEYWGHAASLIDVSLEPALRMRKRTLAARRADTRGDLEARAPGLIDRILGDIDARGPLTARDIEHDEQRDRGHWGWNWSTVKVALEHLFDVGTLSVAGRNSAFERRYALTQHVLPPEILAAPDPDDEEATDVLVGRAARALGVADLTALSGYFYLRKARTSASIGRLVARGELEPVEVAGVPGAHWLAAGARLPRSLHVQALVSPFDSLVFERTRLERLFSTRYRIEIYVPEAKRVHGYYVYLFFLGDAPAARVDLKGDRAAGVLLVQSAWLEDGCDEEATATALASELHAFAEWLGLASVRVAPRGSLADALAARV